jgi:hypothetical protein
MQHGDKNTSFQSQVGNKWRCYGATGDNNMADSMQNGNNNMSDIFKSGNLNKATQINLACLI